MKILNVIVGVIAATVLVGSNAAWAEPSISVPVGDLRSGICQPIQFDGASYIVCPVDISIQNLRMFHENGAPFFWGPDVFGYFDEVNTHLDTQHKQLSFAMNGGMYHGDRSAVGLYIEEGEQSQKLNTNEGSGNFHLLPNGVFFWDDNQARVMEARAFAGANVKPNYATQSGPMLVIDGALHPRFIVNGTSLKMRNGVGVRENGKQVYFAVSKQPVNFESFGRLFRDYLKTPNALFLDGGSASQIFAPNLDRNDAHEKLGPIIAVVMDVDKITMPEPDVTEEGDLTETDETGKTKAASP